MSFGYLGFLRHVFWIAVPKNSPAPAEPKIFYARIHDTFESSFHMPYCGMFSDCDSNAEEFWEIHKKISDEKAKQEKAIHKDGFHVNLMGFEYMHPELHEEMARDLP
ncbi:hypothetical protein PIB30_094102 [Stylosanthes scabra]|uniref:Uncharacterized protein n=1 Tax=Stylosanthes scabra TaxID=79078 RepID=A0ABU6QWD3_9FABA|nr:hypothetical protein [Stylosanthes scabra]